MLVSITKWKTTWSCFFDFGIFDFLILDVWRLSPCFKISKFTFYPSLFQDWSQECYAWRKLDDNSTSSSSAPNSSDSRCSARRRNRCSNWDFSIQTSAKHRKHSGGKFSGSANLSNLKMLYRMISEWRVRFVNECWRMPGIMQLHQR